jgi:N-ethylmaleimide reductase
VAFSRFWTTTMTDALFTPYTLGEYELRNRVSMAPMTRSRATGNLPNALMAEHYGQRASAGLLITEGTAPSPNGLGYARIPGLYSAEQVEGWKGVTKAVHDGGGRIFAQLMHVGRIGHPLNMPEGAELVGPSAIVAPGEMYTDQEGPKAHPVPREMSKEDIKQAVEEFALASRNAVEAGFDGVELHGANGYLIDQFINPHANQRSDEYGGSADARARFPLEVAQAAADAIGKGRVGFRISPHNVFNGLGTFDGAEDAFVNLAGALSEIGIVYLHVADMSSMAGYAYPASTGSRIREAFGGALILNGNYDAARAAADITEGRGDLVAFGRPFIANPDLVHRYQSGAALAEGNHETFYTPGPEGYTDYPAL